MELYTFEQISEEIEKLNRRLDNLIGCVKNLTNAVEILAKSTYPV